MFLLIFLALISFLPSWAMTYTPPQAPCHNGAYCAPDALGVPECTGMVYQHPTLQEVKNSYLGHAIEQGDITPIRNAFDGPLGWRGWLHWLFRDEDNQHVRAAHCLLYAVKFPERITGATVNYLWQKIKANCKNSAACEMGVPIGLVSKGTCLMLNAHANGHGWLLHELVKMPLMEFGACASLQHAIDTNDKSLLKALLAAEVQCSGSVLIEALRQNKTEMARLLMEHEIGMEHCHREHGSALHMAIFKKSPLIQQLITQLPKQTIHCHTDFLFTDLHGKKRVVMFSALDMMLRQSKYNVEDIKALLERHADCGPGAPQQFRRTANELRRKFGFTRNEACLADRDRIIECYDLVKVGW